MSTCKHENTAAASAINTASVWCPDCEQWVQLHKPDIDLDDETRGELLQALYEWINAGGSIDRVITAMDERYGTTGSSENG